MSSDGAKLVRAAGAGDDAKVKRLLKAKVDVNETHTLEGVGTAALHAACIRGHVGAARLLLKAKATVDLPNSNSATPLYIASEFDHLDCARLLLEAKATVDPRAKNLSTPPVTQLMGSLGNDF